MTDKSVVPIDWSQPIEAVHEDGRVEPVIVDFFDGKDAQYYTEPDLSHLPQVWLKTGVPWVSVLGGNGLLSGWRIRNVASNPLNLETSDLDPITPEELAIATEVLHGLKWTRQIEDTVVRCIRAGLAKAGAVIAPEWQPIDTAPYHTVVEIKAGDMTFLAQLLPGASINDDDQDCDQWSAAIEGEHPPCWSGGDCWSSNEDEERSIPPSAWRPAHSIQSGGEGGEAK